jgi:hypothetical protein
LLTRRCGPGFYFPWHCDYIAPGGDAWFSRMTVSFSLLLSGRSEYEGGRLEFRDAPTPDLDAGDLVAFNGSRVTHRVTELVSGARYMVVGFGGIAAAGDRGHFPRGMVTLLPASHCDRASKCEARSAGRRSEAR